MLICYRCPNCGEFFTLVRNNKGFCLVCMDEWYVDYTMEVEVEE